MYVQRCCRQPLVISPYYLYFILIYLRKRCAYDLCNAYNCCIIIFLNYVNEYYTYDYISRSCLRVDELAVIKVLISVALGVYTYFNYYDNIIIHHAYVCETRGTYIYYTSVSNIRGLPFIIVIKCIGAVFVSIWQKEGGQARSFNTAIHFRTINSTYTLYLLLKLSCENSMSINFEFRLVEKINLNLQ